MLVWFKNQIEQNPNKGEMPQFQNVKFDTSSLVYIKKWMRTPHALLFRLSNKIVQVIFEDKSEIVLAS